LAYFVGYGRAIMNKINSRPICAKKNTLFSVFEQILNGNSWEILQWKQTSTELNNNLHVQAGI